MPVGSTGVTRTELQIAGEHILLEENQLTELCDMFSRALSIVRGTVD
jgi:hypothetical protein